MVDAHGAHRNEATAEGGEEFASSETALSTLLEYFKRLRWSDSSTVTCRHPDVRSDDGHRAAKQFLLQLEKTASALGCPVTDRTFRASYTKNYGTLYPDSKHRYYRVDVLEASLETFTEIVVNAEKHEFSPHVVAAGLMLKESFFHVVRELEAAEGARLEAHRKRIRRALQNLDNEFAHFEKCYIVDLMGIEGRARRFIVHCMELNAKLLRMERMIISTAVGKRAMRE
eukprot:Polyplicarium_translucidae@DN282_c0_g1_i1.p1